MRGAIRYCFSILLVLPIVAMAQPGPPPDGPVNSRERKEVIDSLASVLIDGYYDPALAKSMLSQVKKYHKAGRYDTINHGQQFALELTKNLLIIYKRLAEQPLWGAGLLEQLILGEQTH